MVLINKLYVPLQRMDIFASKTHIWLAVLSIIATLSAKGQSEIPKLTISSGPAVAAIAARAE
jgi:hypothetical protein